MKTPVRAPIPVPPADRCPLSLVHTFTPSPLHPSSSLLCTLAIPSLGVLTDIPLSRQLIAILLPISECVAYELVVALLGTRLADAHSPTVIDYIPWGAEALLWIRRIASDGRGVVEGCC